MLAIKFNYCLNQIKNGDLNGLESIYNEYYRKMVFTAFAMVRDKEAAEDIASDFMMYILEKAGEIKTIKNPNAWIYRAINNRAIDYIRKACRTVYLNAAEDIIISTDATLNPDYMCDDIYESFTKSFNVLSDVEKEIVLLHYSYGFKYREISVMLNKPIGSIKSGVSAIKQKLQHLKKFL